MDIPNEFILSHIKYENYMAIIKIRGVLVDIMLDIYPDVYGLYVIMDRKSVKKIIIQCQNAIYSIMTESLPY